MKRKFTLEFDEVPALVFVQRRAGTVLGGNADIYVDGIIPDGVRRITIHAGIDDITTHEIEYLTGRTEGARDNER